MAAEEPVNPEKPPIYVAEPEEILLGQEPRNPEKERQREQTAREMAELRRVFLTGLMEKPLFREWLIEVLNGFGTFEAPFAASPAGFPDREATQFKLGMKAAGWYLWETFDDVAPALASLMRREARNPKEKA